MDKKLERFSELEYIWRLNKLLTQAEQAEREELITDIGTALSLHDMFKSSRFGIYNNDFVNDLRVKEQKLEKLQKPQNHYCSLIGCGKEGTTWYRPEGPSTAVIKYWVCEEHRNG